MTKKPMHNIHPKTDKLESSFILENYGGVGIDWVEFEDGTKSPMLSLRVPDKSDRDELRRRRDRK